MVLERLNLFEMSADLMVQILHLLAPLLSLLVFFMLNQGIINWHFKYIIGDCVGPQIRGGCSISKVSTTFYLSRRFIFSRRVKLKIWVKNLMVLYLTKTKILISNWINFLQSNIWRFKWKLLRQIILFNWLFWNIWTTTCIKIWGIISATSKIFQIKTLSEVSIIQRLYSFVQISYIYHS